MPCLRNTWPSPRRQSNGADRRQSFSCWRPGVGNPKPRDGISPPGNPTNLKLAVVSGGPLPLTKSETGHPLRSRPPCRQFRLSGQNGRMPLEFPLSSPLPTCCPGRAATGSGRPFVSPPGAADRMVSRSDGPCVAPDQFAGSSRAYHVVSSQGSATSEGSAASSGRAGARRKPDHGRSGSHRR